MWETWYVMEELKWEETWKAVSRPLINMETNWENMEYGMDTLLLDLHVE